MPQNPMIRALVIFLIGLLILLIGVAAWLYTQPGRGGGSFDNSGAGVQSEIGVDYSLTNHEGETVTRADFQGLYRLYYFGFTFCPDICPTSLATMTQALDRLERAQPEAAARIQPIFITIDPERDDVAALADYVSHFHPRLIGLTGSQEQIDAVAKGFRIFAQKTDDRGGDDYLMDHTSAFVLMGPDGKFIRLFTHGTPPQEMAEALGRIAG